MLQHYGLRPQTKLFGVTLVEHLTLVKQVLEYFSRVTNVISSDSIDHNAVQEQQALNLPWYIKFLELWNREEVMMKLQFQTAKIGTAK